MSRLEHQIANIMNAMYDSVNNDNFDSISDYTDRVSGVIDNDYDRDDNDDIPYDKDNDDMPYNRDNDGMPYDRDNDDMSYDNDQMPNEYANDNEMAINDRNMTKDKFKHVGIKDMVLYKRDNKMTTKVKWPIETNDINDKFMR